LLPRELHRVVCRTKALTGLSQEVMVRQQGVLILNHFPDVRKMLEIGSNTEREVALPKKIVSFIRIVLTICLNILDSGSIVLNQGLVT